MNLPKCNSKEIGNENIEAYKVGEAFGGFEFADFVKLWYVGPSASEDYKKRQRRLGHIL